jgi:succinate dehydrogenase/fumarate reductase flavoprotein subunit
MDNARMVARAALARRESRGCHFRSDCPLQDDQAWRANLVLSRDGDRMVLAARAAAAVSGGPR